eukprot:1058823-Amphidinium_carterae.1
MPQRCFHKPRNSSHARRLPKRGKTRQNKQSGSHSQKFQTKEHEWRLALFGQAAGACQEGCARHAFVARKQRLSFMVRGWTSTSVTESFTNDS